MSDGDQARLLAALYPSDCHPDDNPVFVLCRNDNCSFTWTGEMHIHQVRDTTCCIPTYIPLPLPPSLLSLSLKDIFVCRSCGLTDSLCCCTECAYSCHRGHDCVFKKASPTAYCDCWERCHCKCLAQTPDTTRLTLLQKLMATTPLANKVLRMSVTCQLNLPSCLPPQLDSSHQSILAVLLTMVTHQSRAQSHWSTIRSSSMHSHSRHEDTPVHNLRPPKFAPKALAVVVEVTLLAPPTLTSHGPPVFSSAGLAVCEVCHTVWLGGWSIHCRPHPPIRQYPCGRHGVPAAGQAQWTGSKIVFTHAVLVLTCSLLPSSLQTLSSLLSTLVKRISHGSHDDEAVGVARCFVRSVVRVWSVCELETTNLPPTSLSSSRRHRYCSDYCYIVCLTCFLMLLSPQVCPSLASQSVPSSCSLLWPLMPFLPS